MGTLNPVSLITYDKVVDVTLSTPAAAIDDNDVLAATQEIANVFKDSGGIATLQSLFLLDEDDQGVAMDIIFLDSDVAIGTENAAVSISDTNAGKIIGGVSIGTADYIDMINSKFASLSNIGLPLQAASGSTSLYIAAVTRGTPTHTASGLKLKLGIQQQETFK